MGNVLVLTVCVTMLSLICYHRAIFLILCKVRFFIRIVSVSFLTRYHLVWRKHLQKFISTNVYWAPFLCFRAQNFTTYFQILRNGYTVLFLPIFTQEDALQLSYWCSWACLIFFFTWVSVICDKAFMFKVFLTFLLFLVIVSNIQSLNGSLFKFLIIYLIVKFLRIFMNVTYICVSAKLISHRH